MTPVLWLAVAVAALFAAAQPGFNGVHVLLAVLVVALLRRLYGDPLVGDDPAPEPSDRWDGDR